ncbi:uncharacterized protein LOC112082916 [Eutrema salsugineum]|uniref:uncharacterized protein LOC112082916 n=1 Tax=Eutrema salsugineum TaxID=72664 RepID=UPI000CED6A84|nr:uncharacterized protein LOC112082916 [Eutrema salsugineum]
MSQNLHSSQCQHLPGDKFHKALKKCRSCLSRWKSQHPNNSLKKIQKLKTLLGQQYDSNPIDYERIKSLKVELTKEYRMEEEYWKTKSRIQWLQAGDRNTSLFQSEGGSNVDSVVTYIKPRVTQEMNQALTKPVTEEELYNAIHCMAREKAPGPDGLNPGFFQDHWHIIKSVKLDISKAFDKVEWNYIAAVMKQMGFSEVWCRWVMKCFTTASYSVLINGQPVGDIKPQRGALHGFKASRSGPPISHLLFADDSLLFCRATENECNTLLHILRTYERVSGKEVLLKSVVTAIPSYSMSCFMLPKSITNQINSAMRRFWWSASKDRHKIPWVAWKKITETKKNGGFGIRDLRDFNIAMLAKQGWCMLQHPTSLLARVFKAKYFPKTNIFHAELKGQPSYAWRSIYQVPPTPAYGPGINSYPKLKVSDLLDRRTITWNEQLLEHIIDPEDIVTIKRIRPSIAGVADSLHWIHTADGAYSVKSGYHALRKLAHSTVSNTSSFSNNQSLFTQCWKHNVPPKVKHFWWRVLHNALPTAVNLKKRKILHDDTCQRCGEAPETVNHMIFQCRLQTKMQVLVGSFLTSKGMEAICPTGSPIETEAIALRSAILHVKRLGYEHVTFCGDAANLYQAIHRSLRSQICNSNDHSLLTTYIQDIKDLVSKSAGFSFLKVPRNVNYASDRLAKIARTRVTGSVISWNENYVN